MPSDIKPNEYCPPWLTQARIDAFRKEYGARRKLFRQREKARSSPEYIEAMRILAEDMEGSPMEEILLQELDDALKRLPEEVSREDVLLFLKAVNIDTH